MTREEAIAFFRDMNECTYGNVEAVEMAIKALEQQPCEDCISRGYFLRDLYCKAHGETNINIHWLEGYVKELPSVQPARIKAKWLKHERLEYDGYIDTMWECSICGQQEYTTEYKYCPNCGAKMDGGNENECNS